MCVCVCVSRDAIYSAVLDSEVRVAGCLHGRCTAGVTCAVSAPSSVDGNSVPVAVVDFSDAQMLWEHVDGDGFTSTCHASTLASASVTVVDGSGGDDVARVLVYLADGGAACARRVSASDDCVPEFWTRHRGTTRLCVEWCDSDAGSAVRCVPVSTLRHSTMPTSAPRLHCDVQAPSVPLLQLDIKPPVASLAATVRDDAPRRGGDGGSPRLAGAMVWFQNGASILTEPTLVSLLL